VTTATASLSSAVGVTIPENDEAQPAKTGQTKFSIRIFLGKKKIYHLMIQEGGKKEFDIRGRTNGCSLS
jgi:hypothetical protein